MTGLPVILRSLAQPFSVLTLLTFLVCGCAEPIRQVGFRPEPSLSHNQAMVTIYFNRTGSRPAPVDLTLSHPELLAGDVWLPIASRSVTVEGGRSAGRQYLLGGGGLPPGQYAGLRIQVTFHALDGKEESRVLVLPLSSPLSLDAGESRCLFVDWEDGDSPEFNFEVRDQQEGVSGEMLFVSCDSIRTLYWVRTDLQWVEGAIGFPGRIGEVRFDPQARRLYLVGTDERVLYVLDAVQRRIIDRISLSSLLEPRFLCLSQDGRHAFVTDEPTGKVIKVDLDQGTIAREAHAGTRLQRLICFQSGTGERIAVSSPGSREVLLLDSDNLDIRGRFPVNGSPAGLLVEEGRLHVADERFDQVVVYDLFTQREVTRIPVGADPVPLVRIGNGRLYAGNGGGDTLSVILPQQNASQRSISIGHGSFDLALLQTRRILFVANRSEQMVTALDLAGERIIERVCLGGRPFSLAVQER